MLLSVIEQYVNGAAKQMVRIEQARAALDSSTDTKELPQLFLDTHFFF